jgi:hypothetical protein
MSDHVHVYHIDPSANKHPGAPRRNYYCDKIPASRAERDTSRLLGKFLPPCIENEKYAPWDLSATRWWFWWSSNALALVDVQGPERMAGTLSDPQRPAQRLGQPNRHSFSHDIHIGLIDLAHHTLLLSNIFISL